MIKQQLTRNAVDWVDDAPEETYWLTPAGHAALAQAGRR